MSRRKAAARPERAVIDPQVLRQLQKAIAVARCIRIAAEYGDEGEVDVADAMAGLLVVLDSAAVLLDRPDGAS